VRYRLSIVDCRSCRVVVVEDSFTRHTTIPRDQRRRANSACADCELLACELLTSTSGTNRRRQKQSPAAGPSASLGLRNQDTKTRRHQKSTSSRWTSPYPAVCGRHAAPLAERRSVPDMAPILFAFSCPTTKREEALSVPGAGRPHPTLPYFTRLHSTPLATHAPTP
jgi:hypothetical protein